MKFLHLSLGLACVSACAETEESIGTLVHEDGPRGSLTSPLADHGRAEALLGRDPTGGLALVRLDDGEIVTRFALGELRGVPDASAFVRDDGSLSHLALLGHDEDEQSGLLRFVPVGSNGFARPLEVAELSGTSRTLALEGGALVMHDEIGQRWSFARKDGQFQPSTACPKPASIIASDSSASQAAVLALAWSADKAPLLVDAELAGDQWQCAVFPLTAPEALGDSARAAMVPAIGGVVVDARKSGLRLARLGGTNVGPTAVYELGAERVEQVEPWALGKQRGIAVLTTRPSALTVLMLEPTDGALLTVVEAATVLLPFVAESSWFARELLVTEDRVFVATDAGLFAFELSTSPALGLHQLPLPASFGALRGPLVAVPRLPAMYAQHAARDESVRD